jgi:hypothetical protein
MGAQQLISTSGFLVKTKCLQGSNSTPSLPLFAITDFRLWAHCDSIHPFKPKARYASAV